MQSIIINFLTTLPKLFDSLIYVVKLLSTRDTDEDNFHKNSTCSTNYSVALSIDNNQIENIFMRIIRFELKLDMIWHKMKKLNKEY